MSAISPNGELDSTPSKGAPAGFERRPSRGPILLLGLIVLGTFFAVGYTMFTRSVVYYKTPTEVLANPGEHVRVSGTVVPGSIETDTTKGTVSFLVTDDTSSVKVVYAGPVPDTLKDRAEAVAEGVLQPDGIFHAETLFARCPSKFQAKS